ncbi:transcriptional regulator [Asticcacaulis solisilvae]|uniref:transcriptional regulator n=1 Tax=Asticcacaulis solisilvae TaxID=1217274 RepID=UPI003FD80D1E
MTPFEALNAALAVVHNNQSELARICGCSQTAVWKMLQAKRMSHKYVLAVETATGVSRHDLRPDIYPRPQPERPAEAGDEGEALSEWDTGAYANIDPNLDLFPGAFQ